MSMKLTKRNHQWPHTTADEKLISQYKKEMEDFIQDKLRIITQGTATQKALRILRPLQFKAQLYKLFETGLCIK